MNTTIHEIGLDDCCRTEILSAEALDFLAELPQRFGARRRELLAVREERQRALLAGGTLDFLPVLNSGARGFMARCACAPHYSASRISRVPADRRVEITGPTDPHAGDQPDQRPPKD
jgi:malate synthase